MKWPIEMNPMFGKFVGVAVGNPMRDVWWMEKARRRYVEGNGE